MIVPYYQSATAFFRDVSGSVGRLKLKRSADPDWLLSGVLQQLIIYASLLSDARLDRVNSYVYIRRSTVSRPTGKIGRLIAIVADNAILTMPINETLASQSLQEIEAAVNPVIFEIIQGYIGLI